MVLRTYTGEEVKPKGSCTVDACYEGGKYSLPLLVVKEEGPALLGRNWLEEIKIFFFFFDKGQITTARNLES